MVRFTYPKKVCNIRLKIWKDNHLISLLLPLLLSHFSHSNSVWPHRWQPTRLPRPWDSPGKNTGVSCHFLLQCMKVKVKSPSHARLLATPWTAAYQSPPSMGFSRQEYWSGVPSPSPKHIAFISKYQTLLWGADLYILTHSILTLTLWVIFTISILQIWKIRQREINLFCVTELNSAGAKIQIKAIFLCPWLHCTIEWNIYIYAHIYGIPW